MLELLTDPQAWIAFLTLTALELVLGIDNIVFLSILSAKVEASRQESARKIGLLLAMGLRVLLLLGLAHDSSLQVVVFGVLWLLLRGSRRCAG